MAREGKKAGFPKAASSSVSPMLATLVDKPMEGKDWLYEVKWDGYRCIALCNGAKSELLSRNQKSFNDKFYPVHAAVSGLGVKTVLDGEIVVIKKSGASSFGALQNWRSEADGELLYYVFDILWLDGYDLSSLPLMRRREILRSVIPSKGLIRFSEGFTAAPSKLLAAAEKLGLEGVIAKCIDSPYVAGARSRDWLKIKVKKRHEVVIGGYTVNENSPKLFSSLLVGVYDDGGKLQYTGKIGTGFDVALQRSMMKSFDRLRVAKAPFAVVPDVNKPSRFRPNPPKAVAVWVKPLLVCEVSYAEMTEDGVMRHPSFEGMREDKAAKDVHAEVAARATDVVVKVPRVRAVKPGSKQERKTLVNPSEDSQVREVAGHELKFGNLSKIYWPKEKYTKRDMLNYYYQVAPFIVNYLKDRPQSLNRYPNGIAGKSFYQKDVTNMAPDWVKQWPYHTSAGEDKNYLVVENEAGLLWMANLGAIEMNPWNSRIQKPDHPDWCIIDLDPTEKNTWAQVIQCAQVVKEVIDEMGVVGYPKTSGSTGLHIYIPMGAKYVYDECQLFGKLIAKGVHERLPAFTSIERLTEKRRGKIYVDYLQNRPKATLAAPYSVRPKPGATVSMPLYWEEVKKGLKMTDYTIRTAIGRLKSEGDIFKPVLGKGVDLKKVLNVLKKG